MTTNTRLIELEDRLRKLDDACDYPAKERFLQWYGPELRDLRDTDATENPTQYKTFCCTHCGSTNVGRDAFAHWNPILGDDELLTVYDDTTCLDCDRECSTYERTLSVRELEALQK